jgi:hypothetical protein
MTEAQREAIAQADAYTNNAGIPTYTHMWAIVQAVRRASQHNGGLVSPMLACAVSLALETLDK